MKSAININPTITTIPISCVRCGSRGVGAIKVWVKILTKKNNFTCLADLKTIAVKVLMVEGDEGDKMFQIQC